MLFSMRMMLMYLSNNHDREKRIDLAKIIRDDYPDAYLLALYFRLDDTEEQFRLSCQRILQRGENHQTLTPSKADYRQVIRMFQRQFDAPDPREPGDRALNRILELDPRDPVEKNLKLVLEIICPLMKLPMPDDAVIQQAVQEVCSCVVDITVDATPPPPPPDQTNTPTNTQPKQGMPVYYGVMLDRTSIIEQLQTYFKQHPSQAGTFFNQLVEQQRIRPEPHVTLMHIAERKRHPQGKKLWRLYSKSMASAERKDTVVQLRVTHIVWNSKIMALRVDIVQPDWVESLNKYPHVTIGIADDRVKPSQANDLLLEAFDSLRSILPAATNGDTRTFANTAATSKKPRKAATKETVQAERPQVIALKSPWSLSGPITAYYPNH
jgi:tRNA ligase